MFIEKLSTIEPIPPAIDDPDCQYRVVKCADVNSREHLYPNNSLWQIDRLLEGDRIIALDPCGNRIEIVGVASLIRESLRTRLFC
jgi:hypothetical protein